MKNHEPRVTGKKICPHCNRELSVLAFGADHRHSDGLHSWCRDCVNEATSHAPSRLRRHRKVYIKEDDVW